MLHASSAKPHPPLFFGVVVFAALVFLLGRGVLPQQNSPAFSVPSSSSMRIFLGEGFPDPGVHQFSDGMTIFGVMELTGLNAAAPGMLPAAGRDEVLVDGMALSIAHSAANTRTIEQGWMPARQRLALGIPLHPDRMNRDDWATLPGIGDKLAARIESDRQNYGDFGRFEALERVKGIGPAKLKKLRPFFAEGDNL